MKIIAITDIHADASFLKLAAENIKKADIVVISGDITNFTPVSDAVKVIKELRKYNRNILAVAGNCDLPPIDEYLTSEGINLDRRCLECQGVYFAGLCGGVPAENVDQSRSLQEHFAKSMDELKTATSGCDPLILVTHQPAKDTMVDQVGGGSEAVADFIRSRQPMLALSGHIHDSPGKDTIGKTILVNPGPFNQGYYAEIDVDDGKIVNIEIKQA